MTRQVSIKTSDVNIAHAIETLSKIADLGLEEQNVLPNWSEGVDVSISHPILISAMGWLHQQNREKIIKIVQEDFKIILDYLKKFDKLGEGILVDPKTLEGMQSIMLLVMEAADKLDGYTQRQAEQGIEIAQPSVKESKEYKELLQFYKFKVAPIASNEKMIQRVFALPIAELLQASLGKGLRGQLAVDHHIIDLDLIRKDQEYELLFLKREDGSRFFNPKLLRSLKLICHFEESSFMPKQAEFFRDITIWNEAQLRMFVKTWTQSVYGAIDNFLTQGKQAVDFQPVALAYKMIYALLLANASSHVIPMQSLKGVKEYLRDFHLFLHDLLRLPEVIQLCHQPPVQEDCWEYALVQLIAEISWAVYMLGRISRDLGGFISSLLHSIKLKEFEISFDKELLFSSKLRGQYARFEHACREFSSEPIAKTLRLMEEIDCFDPFLFNNYPFKALELSTKHLNVPVIRLPFPVCQEFIGKAPIHEEFKEFLRVFKSKHPGRRCMIVNLQDGHSWQELARCNALNDLAVKPEFKNVLSIVSLNRGLEDYLNVSSMDSETFSRKLSEFAQFSDDLTNQIDLKSWIQKVFGPIYEEHIPEHLELYQFALLLDAITKVQPAAIFITCKDGLDSSLSFLVSFYIVLKSFRNRKISEAEEQYINLLLFAPLLLQRGRALHHQRFNRLASLTHFLENARQEGDGCLERIFSDEMMDVIPSF